MPRKKPQPLSILCLMHSIAVKRSADGDSLLLSLPASLCCRFKSIFQSLYRIDDGNSTEILALVSLAFAEDSLRSMLPSGCADMQRGERGFQIGLGRTKSNCKCPQQRTHFRPVKGEQHGGQYRPSTVTGQLGTSHDNRCPSTLLPDLGLIEPRPSSRRPFPPIAASRTARQMHTQMPGICLWEVVVLFTHDLSISHNVDSPLWVLKCRGRTSDRTSHRTPTWAGR